KEEMTGATPEFEAGVRARADQLMARITGSGEKLQTVGQDVGTDLGVAYNDSRPYFRDELPKGLESLWTRTAAQGPVRLQGSITLPASAGQPEIEIPGIFIAETTGPRAATGRVILEAPAAFAQLKVEDPTAQVTAREPAVLPADTDPALIAAIRTTAPGSLATVTLTDGRAGVLFVRNYQAGAETVDVSHILVSYKDALRAEAGVTRTKEEALARAQELKTQLDGGANFEDLARAQSDGPSKQSGGALGAISRGDVAPAFEDVAFTAAPSVVSAPIETAFGYHLIRVNKAPGRAPDTAGYDLIAIGSGGLLKAQTLLDRLQTGKVTRTEEAVPARVLFLSLQPTGWKDTALDGKHFRSAAVTTDPTTGLPVVQIAFDDEGAKLFAELTKANLGKQIAIFVGGELITAPTVQTEITTGIAVITGSSTFQAARDLAQDLNTGSIPAPIYLSGQRTIEPTLGQQALDASLFASLIGLAVTAVYLIGIYRLLGVVANLALAVYALIFIALMKLPLLLVTNSYVVLTLAGIAGAILSIGMSVDLNVLVFERMKEELRKGKSLKTATEIGFERAWPSIRDSNISTLITCAILFVIGTSIVRGFAVTLALGIVVAMVTGVTITRWIMLRLAETPLAKHTWLFGVRQRKD
ncbi:MAG: protein translocase subunit SecD, partial [Candidatus Peribacteraceae bacterium]|nr:protein translocase subunit SecD [Candidatus Peribacteraceae bacterium]